MTEKAVMKIIKIRYLGCFHRKWQQTKLISVTHFHFPRQSILGHNPNCKKYVSFFNFKEKISISWNKINGGGGGGGGVHM